MTDVTLKCEGGWCPPDPPAPVEMIGSKGYIYCGPCGVARRQSGYENVRKLKPAELKKLQRGEVLAAY